LVAFSPIVVDLLAHAALSAFFRAMPTVLAILASVARIGSRAGCGVTDNHVLENHGKRELRKDG
jgi:hypothetical protein